MVLLSALGANSNILGAVAMVMNERDHLDSILFEYADESLAERFQRQRGIFDRGLVAHLWAHAASGIAQLHRLFILHGDLKMENMLLQITHGTRLKLVIADFDFCCDTEGPAAATHTPCAYRPPEVLHTLGRSFPADVWCLGCVLRELLLGRRLWEKADGVHNAKVSDIMTEPTAHVLEAVHTTYPAFLPLVKQRAERPGWCPFSHDYMGGCLSPEAVHCAKGCLTLVPNQRPSVGSLIRGSYVQRALMMESMALERPGAQGRPHRPHSSAVSGEAGLTAQTPAEVEGAVAPPEPPSAEAMLKAKFPSSASSMCQCK